MAFTHKNIRLSKESYLGERSHFITICCTGRRPLLAEASTILWNLEILAAEAYRSGFLVHAYCFMPDHMHVLVQGTTAGSDLLRFVGGFKQKTAYGYRKRTGDWLWQRKYHDHVLRRSEIATRVMAYIWMNPVRKGMVREAEDYPYSGSFTAPWKQKFCSVEEWTPPWKQNHSAEETGGEPG